ncbi:hypothetical protein ABID23_001349 [Bartonella silvatica]|uniref:Uncharacterized protein n=1 Tax=Bartonella silvatica TaxID=357760 RepID=A0ABV2HI56_9HYPH
MMLRILSVTFREHTKCISIPGYVRPPCHTREAKQPFFIDSNLKVYGDVLLLVKKNSISFISEKLRMDILALLVTHILDSQFDINAIA